MNSHSCSNCHTENRAEARFCKRCGFWLLPNCPFCDTLLPEAALFCDHCGRQLNAQVGSITQVPSHQSSAAHPTLPAVPTVSTTSTALPKAVKSSVPEPALVKSELHQYIPKELMNKLQA